MTRTAKTTEFSDILSDVFDIRDVIARFEELEGMRENACTGENDSEDEALLAEFDASDEGKEYAAIADFLGDVKGYGGDEQWRGDWYPVTFIRDSYFTEYAEELVQDIGDLPNNIPDYIAIDWEQTANNIRQDYSSVEIDGDTYWYR